MKQHKRKRKGRVKIRQSATLVHKNDATRVERKYKEPVPKAAAKVYPDNAVHFKVKLRRK